MSTAKPMFTKPVTGKLNPSRNVNVDRTHRSEKEDREAVQASVRDMEWRQVIRPSARRVAR